MKNIKYYIFYDNNISAITVFSVEKFTKLYNKEITSKKLPNEIKGHNVLFTKCILNSCNILENMMSASLIVKDAEYDEIKFINASEEPEFNFRIKLKNENGLEQTTFIFCSTDTINENKNTVIVPIYKQLQIVNMLDNQK